MRLIVPPGSGFSSFTLLWSKWHIEVKDGGSHLETSVRSVTHESVTPETSDVVLFWGKATEKQIYIYIYIIYIYIQEFIKLIKSEKYLLLQKILISRILLNLLFINKPLRFPQKYLAENR